MHACICAYILGRDVYFQYPILGFSNAAWVCKHGTFSSVVLSNIANAGKCDCSDLHPSISWERGVQQRKQGRQDKLDHNQTLKESRLFCLLSRSAVFLAQPSKIWVMCSRKACATQLILAGCCADTDLT